MNLNSSKSTIQQGFSLVELLVVMTIIGVLSSVALPSLKNTVASTKIRSYTNNLAASVFLARSEAVKTNQIVKLCASNNGNSCGGSWNNGWIVTGAGGTVNKQVALTNGYKMTESAGLTSIEFSPTGIGTTAANLTVCKTNSVGVETRSLRVSASGKPHTKIVPSGAC